MILKTVIEPHYTRIFAGKMKNDEAPVRPGTLFPGIMTYHGGIGPFRF